MKNVLQPEDDAATVNWGSGWCMPTEVQWRELYQNTATTWTTQNDVNGLLFSASNGNSLFLPAAGYRWDDELNDVGSHSNYWSCSLDTGRPINVWSFFFYSGDFGVGRDRRHFGLSIRPVRSASQN